MPKIYSKSGYYSKSSKTNQPVSLKFIFSFLAILIVLIVYIVHPNNNSTKNQIKENLEDMLEYTVKTQTKSNVKQNNNQVYSDIKRNISNNDYEEKPYKTKYNKLSDEKMALYNKLLDELKQYPSHSEFAIKVAVNRLLVFKGYPEGLVKVIISDFNKRSKGATNDYTIANLNILTGEMNVSRDLMYLTDIKSVIAVLAHELDHFDKLAQIAKSIGIEKFTDIFVQNGLTSINSNFWEKASMYANTDNFDKQSYVSALKRFVSQQFLDPTGSYYDFYRISENIRNPLEISAYKESDYVYNYYKIPILEWNMRKIVKVFNDIDWSIYNKLKELPLLKSERIAIFNYYYAKAIVETLPEFKSDFEYCERYLNGDLNIFWSKLKQRFSGFYNQEKINDKACEDIVNLLNYAYRQINSGITIFDAAKALQYEMNTLKPNLIYAESVDNLRSTTANYIQYIKQEKIENPSQELNAILTLICIDNNLYTVNADEKIKLNNLKMPKEIVKIYNLNNQKHKFMFIYNNIAFKNIQSNGFDSDKLIELLNQSRLKVGI